MSTMARRKVEIKKAVKTSQQTEKNGFLVFSKVFFHLYAPQKRRKWDISLDFAVFLRHRKILT